MRTVLALAAILFAHAPLAAQVLPSSTIGLPQALAIAERVTGGRVTEAELERRGGRQIYEVEVMREKTLRRLSIDAQTGRVLKSSPLRIKSLWARWFDSDEVRQAGRARPLAAALTDLERRTGGQVRDVSFDVEGSGRAYYEIEIVTPAGATELHLDALTGKRLALALDE